MEWHKLGVFKNLNRLDVWSNIFEYLDIKSVINGLSKSCRSFKTLSLKHISHIKSICLLSLSLDSMSSFQNLTELLKCEKTFLLKINSTCKIPEELTPAYKNKSIIRLKFKTKNGNFSALAPLLRSLSSFNHFTLSGNSQLPQLTEKLAKDFISELSEKKINYLKISKMTLTPPVFKALKKFIKENTPKVICIDISCFYEKASNFQGFLAELWKKKWLLSIDYRLNGKNLFSCTREFLAS